MAAELTDHRWSMEELLSRSLPGDRLVRTVRHGCRRLRRGADEGCFGGHDYLLIGHAEATQRPVLQQSHDTPAGDAYATLPVGDHREAHPIK